jgi:hypothetical protein
MYHGFDWYGRTLEVREVCPKSASSFCGGFLSRLDRIALLALVAEEEASVGASAVVSEDSVVVEVDLEADLEVDSGVDLQDRRVQDVIFLIRIFTPTILVLISRLHPVDPD